MNEPHTRLTFDAMRRRGVSGLPSECNRSLRGLSRERICYPMLVQRRVIGVFAASPTHLIACPPVRLAARLPICPHPPCLSEGVSHSVAVQSPAMELPTSMLSVNGDNTKRAVYAIPVTSGTDLKLDSLPEPAVSLQGRPTCSCLRGILEGFGRPQLIEVGPWDSYRTC